MQSHLCHWNTVCLTIGRTSGKVSSQFHGIILLATMSFVYHVSMGGGVRISSLEPLTVTGAGGTAFPSRLMASEKEATNKIMTSFIWSSAWFLLYF